MRDIRYAEDRWRFIETVQEWFRRKNQFWLLVSALSFGAVIVLQVFLAFASGADPSAREHSEFLAVPLLGLFVLSMFWRSVVHTFLSFTGSLMAHGGIFLYHATNASSQLLTPYTANRLGFGIKHLAIVSPNAVADRYFIVGMFAMAFCLAIAFKPNFFKPKDPEELPYPVWRGSRKGELADKAGMVRLVPVSAMLSYEEQHAVARYKYIVMGISGMKYLVTPYDWVPEGSVAIREEGSNSIIGIL